MHMYLLLSKAVVDDVHVIKNVYATANVMLNVMNGSSVQQQDTENNQHSQNNLHATCNINSVHLKGQTTLDCAPTGPLHHSVNSQYLRRRKVSA